MKRKIVHVNGNINIDIEVDDIKSTELFKRQNKECFYCSKKISMRPGSKRKATKDHFFPKSKGNSLNHNKVFCCQPCNIRKANNIPLDVEIHKYLKLYNGIIFGKQLT